MFKKMPTAKTYDRENDFMSWGKLISKVADLISKQAPRNCTVLDLMCGTGFLVRELENRRPDLKITGLDVNPTYAEFAKANSRKIEVICADVLTWKTTRKFDLVICVGSLHHIEYKNQLRVMKNIKNALERDGLFIYADPLLDEYDDEKQRKLAANRLGFEYLNEVIRNNAPNDVVRATAEVLVRDVMLDGEFKTSCRKIEAKIKGLFTIKKKVKVWPMNNKDGYGDYYYLLK